MSKIIIERAKYEDSTPSEGVWFNLKQSTVDVFEIFPCFILYMWTNDYLMLAKHWQTIYDEAKTYT